MNRISGWPEAVHGWEKNWDRWSGKERLDDCWEAVMLGGGGGGGGGDEKDGLIRMINATDALREQFGGLARVG